jgi:hypothetical protein
MSDLCVFSLLSKFEETIYYYYYYYYYYRGSQDTYNHPYSAQSTKIHIYLIFLI